LGIRRLVTQVLFIAPLFWFMELLQNQVYLLFAHDFGWRYKDAHGQLTDWYSFESLLLWAFTVAVFSLLDVLLFEPRRLPLVLRMLIAGVVVGPASWPRERSSDRVLGHCLQDLAGSFLVYIAPSALPFWIFDFAVFHFLVREMRRRARALTAPSAHVLRREAVVKLARRARVDGGIARLEDRAQRAPHLPRVIAPPLPQPQRARATAERNSRLRAPWRRASASPCWKAAAAPATSLLAASTSSPCTRARSASWQVSSPAGSAAPSMVSAVRPSCGLPQSRTPRPGRPRNSARQTVGADRAIDLTAARQCRKAVLGAPQAHQHQATHEQRRAQPLLQVLFRAARHRLVRLAPRFVELARDSDG